MILRTLLVELYIVACLAAIAVDFYFPQVYFYLLGGLLVWLVLGFYLYRRPAMNRPITGGRPAASATAPAAPAPLPGAGATLGFCAFCAAPLEPGALVCPACGHTVLSL